MNPEQVVEAIEAAETNGEKVLIELQNLQQTAKPLDPLEDDIIGEQNLQANGVTNYDNG